MPEPREHAESRGWIESVLRYVPGFRGYLEKEYRRESDELQRTWLADQLRRSKRGLDDYARVLAEAATIDQLPLIDRLRARLDKVIGRIAGAMQGYSGIFDLVRIDEQDLDRVYKHDVGMMGHVEKLGEAIEALPTSQETPAAVVPGLLKQIDEIERQWDQREDILKGLE